ncbi:MAG: amino acid transporter [Candidatus Firestonebacteria bacterium RIFOXYC2_FULL_39_67]|nr:MAG: amino acid transporter [Candidatus Firestonebacteria bacterium RIFOXYD2_FULL_39_29]OGF55462.1 MAG: amino acid transporter [Candidatus Firestonebacteria bacterium RIFOXYC2_FULL_39_67]
MIPKDNPEDKLGMLLKIRRMVIGKAKDPQDSKIFHSLALAAILAWVGLGSDGLSSSCYGPAEAFFALGSHTYLALIVACITAVTIFIISASYSQIIELFPYGGGGYVVATKLLTPTLGMISGSALLIDYVLTITLSIAAGSDALFSFFPSYSHYTLWFSVFALIVMIVLNLRGVKESVKLLLPIFVVFMLMHVGTILYILITHVSNLGGVVSNTVADVKDSVASMGVMAVIALVMRSYSLGAGTYTGLEAVSNGMSILREPKVKTAKRVMSYMAISLAFVVFGIMFAYLLYEVKITEGLTLNAVLFAKVFGAGTLGKTLLFITLLSEAALLFVAAQTGFLGGPGVMSNMAADRWFPTKFQILSDRLVTQNGVLLMGMAAIVLLVVTKGKVSYLVVLYSINVFITFVLSQLGMVIHWWRERKVEKKWRRKLAINGLAFLLTLSILISVIWLKFGEGGWITILITGSLIAVVMTIKHHYKKTSLILKRLDSLVLSVMPETIRELKEEDKPKYNPKSKTAVVLVSGFNGVGLHTLLNIFRIFSGVYKNFVIVQVGVVDSGAFKGAGAIESLQEHIKADVDKYVNYIQSRGYFAEGICLIGVDVVQEISDGAQEILKKYPNANFFGGQLVFPEEIVFTRWLHNYTVFAIQRRFYYQGIPIILLPIRL